MNNKILHWGVFYIFDILYYIYIYICNISKKFREGMSNEVTGAWNMITME